ncbi:hypothetical protein CspeluHIS016_0201040 [Cutaneotrichosporon spelunceum]|uniref:Uncharacterized protein n=1 Tax=Cutaneotrichosporon spelunceum TaxID=1672016 RepID=A0AAD3TQE3_9TREE|nr:hypothetical protein CspeluHIS016_0201040 [Cutaneotrichosporon spelunceum]
MSFQQLLKRSRFAVHDPLVTRVYASNTSSQRHGGDYGLKSPVNRPRLSRYIRLGKSISGWRSGEEEARFMAQWADGSIPWSSRSDRRLKPASIFTPYAEDVAEPEAVTAVLPNVDAMSEPEFNAYLQDIRSRRSELRDTVFAGTDVPADEATLPHAAAKGLARDSASADFQVAQTQQALREPASKTIQPRPHRLHGLQYSSAPAAGSGLHGRAVPGRALDRVRAGGQRAGLRALEGTNAEWVVGLAGLTATGGSGVSRVTDKASLSQFDYSRERPERGIARFAVSEATVEAPPKVLALGVAGKRWLEQPHFSSARRPAPLQTFRFDLRVSEDDSVGADGKRILPGSAEWVAREPNRGLTEAEGAMGVLGGPRAKRPSLAQRRNSTRAQSDTIDSLLARIAGSAGGR